MSEGEFRKGNWGEFPVGWTCFPSKPHPMKEKEKITCIAYSQSTRKRCQNPPRIGRRYCKEHPPWKWPKWTFVMGIIGSLATFAGGILLGGLLEDARVRAGLTIPGPPPDAPKLLLTANSTPIRLFPVPVSERHEHDSVHLSFNTSSNFIRLKLGEPLTFDLKNTGTKAAKSVTVEFTIDPTCEVDAGTFWHPQIPLPWKPAGSTNYSSSWKRWSHRLQDPISIGGPARTAPLFLNPNNSPHSLGTVRVTSEDFNAIAGEFIVEWIK